MQIVHQPAVLGGAGRDLRELLAGVQRDQVPRADVVGVAVRRVDPSSRGSRPQRRLQRIRDCPGTGSVIERNRENHDEPSPYQLRNSVNVPRA